MLLLFLFSVTSALDPNPTDINKVCYKCNVYSAAGKMKCENPGVCYSNFCYSCESCRWGTLSTAAFRCDFQRDYYVFIRLCWGCHRLSDKVSPCFSVYLQYFSRSISVGLHCQSSGGVALCVCATGKEGCNYPEKSENSAEKLKKILWLDSDTDKLDNISTVRNFPEESIILSESDRIFSRIR